MRRAPAPAKINLAHVVGPERADGKHEVATLLQRIDLADRLSLEPAATIEVRGFPQDTLVRDALVALAQEAGAAGSWRVRIEKHIPVSAGLGGGSSDAATALRLANETLERPLPAKALHALAAGLGADVPFFLAEGPQLGAGDGSDLSGVDVPQDFYVVLVLEEGAEKASTASVYAEFAARNGATGFARRRAALKKALAAVRRPRDLAALPPNDLASSPLAEELRSLGAFRADVSGAGPAVYGLFMRRRDAEQARRRMAARGCAWLTVPAWYG